MPETQSTLFNRRACYLSIAGAFLFLSSVGVVRFLASTPVFFRDPEPVKVRTAETELRRVNRNTPPVFDVSETYYQTIIDNNIFRPLGWTPPRPTEPYRLIGTLLPRSEPHTLPRAILQSTTGQKIYVVSIGEKIDASTEVVSIQGKQVVLSTNGQQRTLHLPSGF